jgi:hypothetical protein
MLDTRTTTIAPSTRRPVTAAVLAGALNAAVALMQVLSPAQPADGHFVRTTDYVIEVCFALSLFGAAIAVLALAGYHRSVGRWGRFGAVAAGAYAIAVALFGVSAAVTAARGQESLDAIQFPAIVLWLIAGLLMAIATVRARVLPIVLGIAFAAGLPATMALGAAGPFALAALWLAVAIALGRRAHRSA